MRAASAPHLPSFASCFRSHHPFQMMHQASHLLYLMLEHGFRHVMSTIFPVSGGFVLRGGGGGGGFRDIACGVV